MTTCLIGRSVRIYSLQKELVYSISILHNRRGSSAMACLPPNCPHKLTKTAEPWLGGGAAFGRLRTARGRHGGCISLPPLHVSRGSRRAARGRPARWAAFAA